MEDRLVIEPITVPFLDTVSGQELETTAFEVQMVNLALILPMKLPFGEIVSRPSGWIMFNGTINGTSFTGYGEGATLQEPLFTDDSGHNIAKNITEIIANLAEHPVTFLNAINRISHYRFTDGGHYPTARLAVEMSLLDIFAKANDLSVKQLIGISQTVSDVPYGFSMGASTKEDLIAQAEKAIEEHATKIKLKISPETHKTVTEVLNELMKKHPNVGYMIDANGTYDPLEAAHIRSIQELDSLGLLMIEEPVSRIGKLRDIPAVRALRDTLPKLETDICLDDCLKTFGDCMLSIEDGLAQIINIKPGRIGSFVKSLLLIDWAKENGGQVMVGGMLEATPGRCMTTLLGAYCLEKGFTIPGDLSLAQERLSDDLVPKDKQMQMNENGNIALPTGKGWGF